MQKDVHALAQPAQLFVHPFAVDVTAPLDGNLAGDVAL